MIEELIKPETDLEREIISDPEFIEGAMWGKPRNGHPEGAIIHHIRDVLANIDKQELDSAERTHLRLIAIVHDAFKYKVDPKQTRSGENHHAMRARRFAEKYIQLPWILDIIELHDEAYNAWCKGNRKGQWDKAEKRAYDLIDRLGDYLDLYLVFYSCDNATGSKESDDFKWFVDLCEK